MELIDNFKFDDETFGKKVNEAIIYEVLKMQLANARLGTNLCRNRALLSGTTAKWYRQKGTGRARHGDLKANIMVGGGKAFGPKPRKYTQRLTKKVRRAAIQQVLSLKKNENKVRVVDELDKFEGKTKLFKKGLDSLSIYDAVIVAGNEEYDNVFRCARNLKGVKLLRPNEINVRDLLNHDIVLFTKKSVETVQEGYKS